MNFYRNKLKEIEDLINKKAYVQACILVETELSAPYLPLDYEQKIRHFLKVIKVILKNRDANVVDFINNISFSKLQNILLSQHCTYLHPFIFAHLTKPHIAALLPTFTTYLQRNDLSPVHKSLLLSFLATHKVDHTFLVQKTCWIKKVNPTKLLQVNQFPIYQDALGHLMQIVADKNTNVLKLSQDILLHFCFYFYPFLPSFLQAWELACVIYGRCLSALNNNIKTLETIQKFAVNLPLAIKINNLFTKNKIF